jgi:Spy/CpxP family protein refolding chaperone
MRRIHVMGLAAIAIAAVAAAALAAGPAHAPARAPAANPAGVHAPGGSPAGADVEGPEDGDGIERMDGPDAWDQMGMGPAGLAVPYGRGGGARGLRMRGMAERRLEMAKQLDLSAEQRHRMESIRDRQQRFLIEQRSKLELARLDLRAMLRGDAPSRASLEAKVDEISRLQAQTRKARLDAMLDLRGVLTPEQQRKLKALREGMGGRGSD